jgi:hypothetical protein
MQFLRDGFEGCFLDLELGAQHFLFVFLLHSDHILFLLLPLPLVKKEHAQDKAYQQKCQQGAGKDYKVDFLILILHRKAMVNKE